MMQSRKSSAKFKKAPGAPKRFRPAFIFFSAEKHKEIRAQLAQHSSTERTANISKLVAEAWRSLAPKERSKWEALAQVDMSRYNIEKSMYTGPWRIPKLKKAKDISAPRRPMSAFLAFANSRRADVTRYMPRANNGDVSRALAKLWKEAPEAVRQRYIIDEKEKRVAYLAATAEWKQKTDKKALNEKLDFALQLTGGAADNFTNGEDFDDSTIDDMLDPNYDNDEDFGTHIAFPSLDAEPPSGLNPTGSTNQAHSKDSHGAATSLMEQEPDVTSCMCEANHVSQAAGFDQKHLFFGDEQPIYSCSPGQRGNIAYPATPRFDECDANHFLQTTAGRHLQPLADFFYSDRMASNRSQSSSYLPYACMNEHLENVRFRHEMDMVPVPNGRLLNNIPQGPTFNDRLMSVPSNWNEQVSALHAQKPVLNPTTVSVIRSDDSSHTTTPHRWHNPMRPQMPIFSTLGNHWSMAGLASYAFFDHANYDSTGVPGASFTTGCFEQDQSRCYLNDTTCMMSEKRHFLEPSQPFCTPAVRFHHDPPLLNPTQSPVQTLTLATTDPLANPRSTGQTTDDSLRSQNYSPAGFQHARHGQHTLAGDSLCRNA